MAKNKQKKISKELKQPDHFVDFWTHAWQRAGAFIGPRQKPAIAAGVALAVVLIGASIINAWDGSRREDASRKMMRIQEMANAEVTASDATESKDVPPPKKDDVPRFKTVTERDTAVLKETDQFLSTSGSRELKGEASIVKGAALLSLGRHDEALSAYQAALDAKLDARLRFLAHEGQGYAYEGKGELDKALTAFAQLSADANEFRGFYQDHALYQKGRLTALKGDKAGALALYKQILTKFPDTSLKDEVTDRLAVLEAK